MEFAWKQSFISWEFIWFSCLFPTPCSICSWSDPSMWCSRITSGASWADVNWGISDKGSQECKARLAMQTWRQAVGVGRTEEHYQDAWSPSGALFGVLFFPAICRRLQTFIPCFVNLLFQEYTHGLCKWLLCQIICASIKWAKQKNASTKRNQREVRETASFPQLHAILCKCKMLSLSWASCYLREDRGRLQWLDSNCNIY